MARSAQRRGAGLLEIVDREAWRHLGGNALPAPPLGPARRAAGLRAPWLDRDRHDGSRPARPSLAPEAAG
jgi:hypothetical protein